MEGQEASRLLGRRILFEIEGIIKAPKNEHLCQLQSKIEPVNLEIIRMVEQNRNFSSQATLTC
jgi:hypothetical protein